GAYICGEETALLESLEGERGQPRTKPPFPAIAGLYASPTVVNNVETMATVPPIITMGGAEYAKLGVPDSRGTRLVSLSGHIVNGGNYEVENGISLRDLIYGLGGGIPEGRRLKCVIPGGSSTAILRYDEIDVGYDFNSLLRLKTAMGSAGVIVLDERCCMVQLGIRVNEFYEHESCGKCTPCREGTRWMSQILRRLEAGDADKHELDLLLDVCDRINGKCLCPLGETAAIAAGVEIPVFCYEPRLGPPVGACRMCLCEVTPGPPKPQAACTLTAADGMVVKTALTSEMARIAQNATLEFILVNHPLDCPVCDKGGECPLQDLTFRYGPGNTRMTFPKRTFDKPIPISTTIALDRERCILCYRCTRFSETVAEDLELVAVNRGSQSMIATFGDEPYRGRFSGNVTELCPVGALLPTTYRFEARPWEIQTVPTVCGLCPVG